VPLVPEKERSTLSWGEGQFPAGGGIRGVYLDRGGGAGQTAWKGLEKKKKKKKKIRGKIIKSKGKQKALSREKGPWGEGKAEYFLGRQERKTSNLQGGVLGGAMGGGGGSFRVGV